jgi:copper transport protein
MKRRLAAVAALLTLLGMLFVGLAAPASAHAYLRQSDPVAGIQLSASPGRVALQFTEPVSLNSRSLVVTDGGGRRVDRGRPRIEAGSTPVVAVDLLPALPKGSYTVVYRVVSDDAHPVSGSFAFGVGVPAGTPGEPESSDPVVALMHGLGRAAALLAAVVLVGVPGFVLLVWPGGAQVAGLRRVARVAWLVSVISTGWLFLWQGPYGAGLGVGAVTDGQLWAQTVEGQYGKLLLLRLVALGTAAAVLLRLFEPAGAGRRDVGPGEVRTPSDSRPGSRSGSRTGDDVRRPAVPLAALAVLYLVSFSFSQHSGFPPWQPFAGLADLAHLGAAALWLGGLVALAVVLRPGVRVTDGLAAALGRWSRLAAAAVAVLVVTGTIQAYRQVREPAAAMGTDYGRLVLGKVGLLVVLLALAWTARLLVARRLSRDDTAVGGLRTRVVAELALGTVAVLVTSVLVNTVPAREAWTAPITLTLPAGDSRGRTAKLQVDVSSTKPGPSVVDLRSTTTAGAVLPFSIVTGVLTEPDRKLGPVVVRFSTVERGHARAIVQLPAAGTWKLALQVSTDGVAGYTATGTVPVR